MRAHSGGRIINLSADNVRTLYDTEGLRRRGSCWSRGKLLFRLPGRRGRPPQPAWLPHSAHP